MTKNATMKQELIKAAEFYENRAESMKRRMERATEGSEIQRDIRYCYEYRKGQAKAMREALALIEEYIG